MTQTEEIYFTHIIFLSLFYINILESSVLKELKM